MKSPGIYAGLKVGRPKKSGFVSNKHGVSEVIATILLVSMTVVITSVIWYWVQGYLPNEKAKNPTASADVDISDVEEYGKVYVYIRDVSEEIGISDVEFRLENDMGVNIIREDISDPSVYGTTYIDTNHNGLLDDGDFFSLDEATANHGKLVVVHKPTHTIIVSQDIVV